MIPSYLKPYHTKLSNLIRLGRKYDGGYVIDKRVIGKTRAIVTCGLEAEWSFEKEFQKYNGDCKIIAFDHTVNKKFWINRFLKDFVSLLLLPFINTSHIRSSSFRPLYRKLFWLFVADCLLLGWIGCQPVEDPYVFIGQAASVYFFVYFLVCIPFLGKFEKALLHYTPHTS